jgi:hypothetical protein
MVMPRAFSSGAASIWSYALASPPNLARQHRRDRRRQRRLAVVHVTNRAHVHVRLGTFKFPFAIFSTPKKTEFIYANTGMRTPAVSPHPELVPLAGIGPATSPLPRECSTTEPQGRKLTKKPELHQASGSGAGDGNRTRVISLEG